MVQILIFLFLNGVLGGGVQLGPLGIAATNGLLCEPRVIMMMEKFVEWLAGETEILEEILTQRRFVHYKPPHAARTSTRAVAVGSQRTNRLGYGTA
jgi:hypothetical protein